ncbi:cobalt/nickel transport system permease protein [Natronoarchaeum philippinense]|uniref:Cobalt/nickel transport system permease protein n=1 Tax=Natronoarchaeum philippinense TaxID=558529 RepID=A0A285N0F5_NATPI|nr:energy-coupling factor ABC transporter permease [Natronoarchaeum philippinense]SNZ02922.1 cobalt/nickel transport system permease protein [Natronoarchaeum philippinense]
MHTPDGYLHPWMAGAFLALAGLVLSVAAMRARDSLTEYRIQLFGIVAAAVFAAQLLNWPIPGGTSAHFVGGAFAAIALGPHLGALAVALVVTIQALVFADGGALALGANVWNMAIVQAYVGYAVYASLADRNETVATIAGGWVGITAAAASASLQLGTAPAFGGELLTVVAVMVGGHAVLGLGEGLLTLVGCRLLARTGVDTEQPSSEGVSA